MQQSTDSCLSYQASSHASLAALGLRLKQMEFFTPIHEQVHVPQKTLRYPPTQKLYAAFVATLAGARGMVELEGHVRADPGLQAAFGLAGCAETSVVQDTLNACTEETLAELEAAVSAIYRQHGQGHGHDYGRAYQVLDVDMSGMPCGPKAEFATKGYFAGKRGRHGRQLGRVLAARYGEVVVDRLFAGTRQLSLALQPLLEAAETTLALDEARRARTIVRVDSGGGSLEQVNWVLSRGYQFHGKDYSPKRAEKLAKSVTRWVDDPKVPTRQVGWVEAEAPEYVRPVRRVAVRCRNNRGGWSGGVLISTLTAEAVLKLTGKSSDGTSASPDQVLLAYVYFYDERAGTIEGSLKQDKQGLGISRRNKKRLVAQQVLVQLNALAHNVLRWARGWLAATTPRVAAFGVVRLRREVFGATGHIVLDARGEVVQILLNSAHRGMRHFIHALQELLGPNRGVLNWGQS